MNCASQNLEELLKANASPLVLAGMLAERVKQERARIWKPLPGPQTEAFKSAAFETLFGGAAGGGKSFLLLGLARSQHKSVLLLRRTYPELEDSLILKSKQVYGNPERYNVAKHVWEFEDGTRIRFGHLEHEDDVHKYLSSEFDLVGFDELTQFTQFQYEYLLSRARTTLKGQRVRLVACTNPGGEGHDWVVARWAAWLDETYPHPAAVGELRYFKRDDSGHEIETMPDDPEAMSRTFIAARLIDNPYLGEDYRRTLNLLPEPLRSQLLHGDWKAGQVDEAYQLIPRAWIKAAMARWTAEGKKDLLTSLGVDVARGGNDKTVIAKRYGNWIAPLEKYPGTTTSSGQDVVTLFASSLTHGAVANIDVIGVGASAYDIASAQNLNVQAINVAEKSDANDKSGKLSFTNKRAEYCWRLREKLDPDNGSELALPNDPELLADLCALRWRMQPNGIRIESKDEMRSHLGRSPDAGDAVMLAFVGKKTTGCYFF